MGILEVLGLSTPSGWGDLAMSQPSDDEAGVAHVGAAHAGPSRGPAAGKPAPATAPAKRPSAPGDASGAVMTDLDPASLKLINDATDKIFWETQKANFPPGQKIPSRTHEMAEIWLATRDGVMQGLLADPKPNAPQPPQPQRKAQTAEVEAYLKNVLKLSDAEIAKLRKYTEQFAMAEDKTGEKGAQRLMEGLNGKSVLGNLSDEAKSGLLHEFGIRWLYSPDDKEEGATQNLAALTGELKKGDPKTAKMAAEAFNNVGTSVPRNRFDGGNYQVLEKERDIQGALWDAAIDLDPMGTVAANKDGVKLATRVLGQNQRFVVPGARWEGNPDMEGGKEPPPSEERRNAVMNAVAKGALSKEEGDKFFDRVFNSSSRFDVSPRDSILGTALDVDKSTDKEQEAMGQLLGHAANAAHAKNEEDEKANTANLAEIVKSPGGREVLFTTSMPSEMRLWAVDMMSADSGMPGKKPWTAKDLERGWESPVVGQAYAGAAVKQAQERFPEPLKLDASKDRGLLTNAVGQLLNITPDKKPGKDETADEKKQREDEGLNHAIYADDEEPMKLLMGHIGSGDVAITAIPVSLMNRQEGAALFQVLRVQKDEKLPPFFLDDKGHKYETVEKWKGDNKLPAGAVTYPKELTLGNALETIRTPSDSTGSRLGALGDKVAMAAGAVAGVAMLIGSGGTLAPLVAGAVAVYSGTRAVQRLADAHSLGHDVTDLHDSEIRGAYIDIASNAFAVGSLASTKLISTMTAEGARISRAGANLIAGLHWGGNLTDAVGLANQINDLGSKWAKMDEAARAEALLSLGFSIGMKAAAVKQGGGLREQFDVTRIRNQIEHGTPYSVEPVKKGTLQPGESVGVVPAGKGKFKIGYEGEYPSKEMIDLHSDAAVSMEASFTLEAKLRRLIGKDADKPPAGSVAWEATEEIKKIRSELETNLSKMNSADAKGRQDLVARQVELNEAIVRENAKLDHWAEQGRGVVAAPASGAAQAKEHGWDKVKLPSEEYRWVANGDGEPHLFAPGKEKLFYDPRSKKFITESKRARLEATAHAAGPWFEQTFDTKSKKPIGELVPDETINAKKGGMPDVLEPGMSKAQEAQDLAAALSVDDDQLANLTELTGTKVSKDFGEAWKKAAAKSQPAKEALDKIKANEKLAVLADKAGDTKRAQMLREKASKLAKEAYDPVREQFWKEVYADGKARAKIEAAGLTFEEGKAPYLRVPDPEHPGQTIDLQITLEHFDRKTDAPLKAQDAGNLLFSFRYENTRLLEAIRLIVRKQMGVNPGQPHPMN